MPFNETREPRFTQTYFIEQGKSIHRLHYLFNAGISSYHVKRLSSLILEFLLYLFFVAAVAFIFALPSASSFEDQFNQRHTLVLVQPLQDANMTIVCFKLLLVFALMPLLLLAVFMGRVRRKNRLIHEALEEVNKMKTGFEEALNRT